MSYFKKPFCILVSIFALLCSFSSLAHLPIQEAFKLELKADNTQVVAHWTIAPGTYLYQSRLKFNTSSDIRITASQLPPGEIYQDVDFGEQIIYKKDLKIPLQFSNISNVNVQVPVEIRYQGCSQEGFCYPPQTQKFTVELNKGEIIKVSPVLQGMASLESIKPSQASTNPAFLPSLFHSSNTWMMFLGAFAIGVVLCFTPCVLPMVPMLSALIIGKKNIQTFKAFSLSSVYVLSMSTTYAIAGISAAILGQRIQTAFQSPWVLFAFAALFVILGLELAGHLSIRFPDFIKSRAYQLQNKSEAGTYLGAVAMGVLATLVASPCVSAPLMGVLAYITQTGDVVVGGLTLFAIGLGMGTPLVIAATLGGKYLPKTGRWMQVINECFAILLFAFAIWILERFIPAMFILPLWAILCLYVAYKLGSFNLKLSGLMPRFGMLFVVASAVLLLNQTPFDMYNRKAGMPSLLAFNTLSSLPALENAIEEAKQKNQPTVVEFYADWCTSCKKMEKQTLNQSMVQTQLKNWNRVKANITGNTQNEQALLNQFNLVGPPSILFFDKDGVEQPHLRLTGEVSPDKLIEHLKKIENS